MKIRSKELQRTLNGKLLPTCKEQLGHNPPKRKTYPQNWTAYNQAKAEEKLQLMEILEELLNQISFPEEKAKVGRKSINIKDRIFYLVLQSYNLKSSRTCISDITIAKEYGYINKVPDFNTVLKYLKDPLVTSYLNHLIMVSGLPLQNIEQDFAVDSSGFSVSQFDRWFNSRIGESSEKRRFRKAHVTSGVKTNIITAVNITDGFTHDSSQFESLITKTKNLYSIREISADKAYSSKDNLRLVSEVGGVPYIPFKRNITGKSSRCSIWRQMYIYYLTKQEEFMNHYHKRSNAETVFHMLKIRFGGHLRSKSSVGQDNEILAKCLCHNLCVLIQEAFELGIDLNFEKCANVPIAYN